MNPPLHEDDPQLAAEWPLAPPRPLAPEPDGQGPLVLLLARRRGRVRIHDGRVEIWHQRLREPLAFGVGDVHSVVQGPVPRLREGLGLRRRHPADHVGELPLRTHWVADLGPTMRPADLLFVLVPPQGAVRGVAMRLAEPGMVDVVLPQVFGSRLVRSLADDAWAYLLQEDPRFTVDPVDWVRTGVRS